MAQSKGGQKGDTYGTSGNKIPIIALRASKSILAEPSLVRASADILLILVHSTANFRRRSHSQSQLDDSDGEDEDDGASLSRLPLSSFPYILHLLYCRPLHSHLRQPETQPLRDSNHFGNTPEFLLHHKYLGF